MLQQIIKISLNNYYILQKLITIKIIWVGYFFLVFNDIHVSLFHTKKIIYISIFLTLKLISFLGTTFNYKHSVAFNYKN